MLMIITRFSTKSKTLFFLFYLICLSSFCHRASSLDTFALKKHVYYLASDSLSGRMTGSKGEELASQYIIQYLKESGCVPCFSTGSYTNSFSFLFSRIPNFNTILILDDSNLFLDKEFRPLAFSSTGDVKGEILLWNDAKQMNSISSQKSFIALLDIDEFNAKHPHEDYNRLRFEFDSIASYGAKAILLINKSGEYENWVNNFKLSSTIIPVAYISDSSWSMKAKRCKSASLKIAFNDSFKTGSNICGYIPGTSSSSIILGAHYDHLGVGQESNSSLDKQTNDIHYGADDNASGVSMVLELTKEIKKLDTKGHNFVFTFFSGEELGLLGSKHFLNQKNSIVFSIDSINYMLNFDMVGRLKNGENNLLISGTGTSILWDSIIDKTSIPGISVKKTESGIGPSDHSSFYFKGIPALHFFTGPHSDYHKPSDTPEKVNYYGMSSIGQFVISNIQNSFTYPKLIFRKTASESKSTNPSFKVTLGIVPDYSYEKLGLRIDGIISGKPAEKSGLLGGDIILKLNGIHIKDIQTYMYALSICSKGQTVQLEYMRGSSTFQTTVTF